jgi:hypothetical protein
LTCGDGPGGDQVRPIHTDDARLHHLPFEIPLDLPLEFQRRIVEVKGTHLDVVPGWILLELFGDSLSHRLAPRHLSYDQKLWMTTRQ